MKKPMWYEGARPAVATQPIPGAHTDKAAGAAPLLSVLTRCARWQAAALLLGLSLVTGFFSISVPLINSGGLRAAAAASYAFLAAATAVLYVAVT